MIVSKAKPVIFYSYFFNSLKRSKNVSIAKWNSCQSLIINVSIRTDISKLSVRRDLCKKCETNGIRNIEVFTITSEAFDCMEITSKSDEVFKLKFDAATFGFISSSSLQDCVWVADINHQI